MDKHDKHHKPKHGHHDKHAGDKAPQGGVNPDPQAVAGAESEAPVIAPHGKHVKKNH
jgi:hypothetical protein